MPVFLPRVALIVDPDKDTRAKYGGVLTPLATTIEYAEDGREALVKAIANPPNFVITDTRLAFVSGCALCSLLRADPLTADVRIVLIAADADPNYITRALASGADHVLMKPCTPEALLEAVARGRAPSVGLDGRAAAASETSENQDAPSCQSPAPRCRRPLVRSHQRMETRTPSLAPPRLQCPSCDKRLQYVRSNIGGVNARRSEQWDYYVCTSGCGTFQYRQRTRKLREVQQELLH
jgi:CheY-like chemotaxis protein